jgi:hypothetical protein
MPDGFVTVTGLYERRSNSGRLVYFGQWGQLRLYLFPHDGAPAFWLAVRAEDYNPQAHGPAVVTDHQKNGDDV